MLTRKILPQMKLRIKNSNNTKKCAVISMSSAASFNPSPFILMYSCTKVLYNLINI